VSVFTDKELAYLAETPLGRMATAQRDGTLQVNPVGFRYNPELDTIDVPGWNMGNSQKFRNAAANGRVAFVIDDIPSRDPRHVRFLEIRGVAEAVPGEDADHAIIRITPRKIIGFGVETPAAPHEVIPNSRRVG
jgi:pyridoxamine 5'-phosphate oxidase family protein